MLGRLYRPSFRRLTGGRGIGKGKSAPVNAGRRGVLGSIASIAWRGPSSEGCGGGGFWGTGKDPAFRKGNPPAPPNHRPKNPTKQSIFTQTQKTPPHSSPHA